MSMLQKSSEQFSNELTFLATQVNNINFTRLPSAAKIARKRPAIMCKAKSLANNSFIRRRLLDVNQKCLHGLNYLGKMIILIKTATG